MSHTWKLLPLAVLAALGLIMIGAPTGVRVARADIDEVTVNDDTVDDGDTMNVDDGDSIDVEVALGSPRPSGLEIRATSVASGSEVNVNFESCDDNSGDSSDDCEVDSGDGSEDLVVVDPTYDSPEGLQRVLVSIDFACDEEDNIHIRIDEFDGGEDSFSFDVNCGASSPTATATSTVGPAATVNVSSSNDNLGCGATSIVTITVLDENGDPVAAGTLVNIVTDKGSVSPASGQTTTDGSVFVFFTAGQTGGTATITAASGSAIGETEIDINCNVEPTQAPPPTTDTSGSIQPPNTGDGGLLDSNGNSWQTYAGILLILASVTGTLAVIRPRA
jgi:hypothetical protein